MDDGLTMGAEGLERYLPTKSNYPRDVDSPARGVARFRDPVKRG